MTICDFLFYEQPDRQDGRISDWIRGYIQKFPDSVDNETNKQTNNNNNKHSLRSNRKGYGGKTH
jgi:hypothetical protein